MSRLLSLAVLDCVCAIVLCVSTASALAAELPAVASGTRGMVVSVSAPASAVGLAVLKEGGNAVDAAVAVALTLQVTWPEAGNIGGGGFMLVHPAPQAAVTCIEYRETAPVAATADMFTLDESMLSCRAVGVPGTLRGLELAHRQFGSLPWKRLIAPAIQLAHEGFAMDQGLATSLNQVLQAKVTGDSRFAEFRRVYGHPGGGNWRAGDVLQQPDLATTLRRLSDAGVDDFYCGELAHQLVKYVQAHGGLITLADLQNYEARLRDPVQVRFRGYDVYGPPLPSSGGVCLAEMLQVLDQLPLTQQPRWTADNVHLQIETMRRVFLDRARFLGDTDFVPLPPELLTLQHARELADSIDRQRATPSRDLAPDIAIVEEPASTAHFSILDGQGMAVSNTYTLEQSFGARIVVPGLGFLLNNEMGDFNRQAGHTDTRGRIGTPANLIAPGKRMLSSQTPVIVTRAGETVLVTGSPGGRTIINTVLCVLLNVLQFEMPLAEAVAQPRLHQAWLPDVVQVEATAKQQFPELLEDLRSRGHTLRFVEHQGDAHSISRNPASGEIQGVADRRRSGSAQGF